MAEDLFSDWSFEGVRWKVRSDYLAAFSEGIYPQVVRALAGREADIIKKGPARTVFRICCRAEGRRENLVCKEYRTPTLFDKLRFLFKKSKGLIEWRKFLQVNERGIATVEVIAAGEARRYGFLAGNYLLSRELTDSYSLDKFILRRLASIGKKEAGKLVREGVKELAGFVLKIHESGLIHKDFHAGNILMRLEGKKLSFYLIDLDRVVFRKKLSPEERLENLVVFNRFFFPLFSRITRLRFFKEYVQGYAPFERDLKNLAGMIERKTEQSLRALWRKRDIRCMGSNKYFAGLKRGAVKWIVRKKYLSPALEKILENPEAAYASGKLLEESGPKEVSRVLANDFPNPLLIKKYPAGLEGGACLFCQGYRRSEDNCPRNRKTARAFEEEFLDYGGDSGRSEA